MRPRRGSWLMSQQLRQADCRPLCASFAEWWCSEQSSWTGRPASFASTKPATVSLSPGSLRRSTSSRHCRLGKAVQVRTREGEIRMNVARISTHPSRTIQRCTPSASSRTSHRWYNPSRSGRLVDIFRWRKQSRRCKLRIQTSSERVSGSSFRRKEGGKQTHRRCRFSVGSRTGPNSAANTLRNPGSPASSCSAQCPFPGAESTRRRRKRIRRAQLRVPTRALCDS